MSEVAGVLPPGTPPAFAKTLFSMLTPEVDSWLKTKPDVKQARGTRGLAAWVLGGLAWVFRGGR